MKNLIMLFILFSLSSFGQTPRYQTIVAGEYFINSDPGSGHGFNLPGDYNLTEVEINLLDIIVPVGSTIYIRFKSSDNQWSPPRGIKMPIQFTNSQAKLVRAEYYINNDPGIGNGTQVDIQSAGIITISGLDLHKGDKIFVRVKDSFNRWSSSKPVKYDYKVLNNAEYYVKLGTGNSTNLQPMIMDQPSSNSFIFSAYQNNITWHQNDTVFVRFQSEDKFYSAWTKGPLGNPTGVESNHNTHITDYKLEQNYPNPFNPSTTITYQVPEKCHVTLKVYNLLGKEIETLVNEEKNAGSYKIEFNTGNSGLSVLPSGVYFYQISVGSYTQSRKMILLK